MTTEPAYIERELRIGDMWAYRARAHSLDCPVVMAEILQFGPKRSGKVRVRLHGGDYPGLDQWVPKVRLRVPWDECEAWLRDEHALDAALDASDGAKDSVEFDAADLVFGAYPRPDGILLNWPRGAVVCMFEPAAAAADLGCDVEYFLTDPLAFIDRRGEYFAPFSVAKTLVDLVIAKYCDDVLREVSDEEAQLQEEAIRGKSLSEGVRYAHVPAEKCAERLRERQPVFELVRAWCGTGRVQRFDEIASLRAEVHRLQGLVLDAAERFAEAGRPQIASRLRKAVAGSADASTPKTNQQPDPVAPPG